MYHFSLHLFYLKDCIIVYQDRMFYFAEFINILFILFYNFIKFIILLYTFLVISFIRYKEYITWWSPLSEFSDVLPAFTFASAIGNL